MTDANPINEVNTTVVFAADTAAIQIIQAQEVVQATLEFLEQSALIPCRELGEVRTHLRAAWLELHLAYREAIKQAWAIEPDGTRPMPPVGQGL